MEKKIHLGIVFATLLSDGSIRNDGMLIELQNKDIFLIKHFKSSLKSLFNLPDSKFKGDWRNQKIKYKKIHICSAYIAQFLLAYGSFRHNPFYLPNGKKVYPITRIPSLVMKDKEVGINFLRMYASCDGCVEVTPRYTKRVKIYRISGGVTFACENPTLNLDLYKLLISLSFQPIRDSKRVRLVKIADIVKYEKEIGFVEGAKTLTTRPSNRFYGKKKNDILKLLVHVSVYGIPYNIRKVPNSKENKKRIIKYLRVILKTIENKRKLPKIQMKKKCVRLKKEEREWLLKNKISLMTKGRKYRISALQVSKTFEKTFGRRIHWGTIYQFWRMNNNVA